MTLHKKRCVVFFTEGETEDEFYGCLLNEINTFVYYNSIIEEKL